MSSERPEYSQSGQRIYRPTPGETRPTTMLSDAQINQIVQHMHQHVGPVDPTVFHEIVSDSVHIDVHFIRPTRNRPFYTLFTTGMSALPMALPRKDPEAMYAELMIHLPAGWPLDLSQQDQEAFGKQENYWPIYWLKKMARLPHEYHTFLAPWVTVPSGDPPTPFAPTTELCCWLVLFPMLLDEQAHKLCLSDRTINFYNLIPLYREEMQIKLDQGVEALVDTLTGGKLSSNELAIIAPDRPNTVLSPHEPSMHLNDNSQASDPGRITLSLSRLFRLEPDLTPPPPCPPAWMFWKKQPPPPAMAEPDRLTWIERITEHLAEGDARAAVVVSTKPLVIAAYTDELDCVAMLRFPDWLVQEYRLQVGSRLLTVNTYRTGRRAADLESGPNDLEQYGNFHPLIADFLTDDLEHLQQQKARITEAEWQHCMQLGQQYPKIHGRRTRHGSPLRANLPT